MMWRWTRSEWHLDALDCHRPLRIQLIRIPLMALLFAVFEAFAFVIF